MLAELVVAAVVIAPDGRLFQGPVHSLDLAVGPGMVGLGQPVLDAMLAAAQIEHVRRKARGWTVGISRRQGELDAIVGEHGVDGVRHSCNQGR